MMNDSKKAKQMMKSSKMVAISLLESVAALAFLCAKYTRRASRKIVGKTSMKSNHKKMIGRKKEFGEESFGEGGLWRRSILMGDKCEPLNFSGVIYYDVNGNKLSEPPIKSPRASPFVPGYGYPTTLQNY